MMNLLAEIGVDVHCPVLYSDSTAALASASNVMISKRMRHVALAHHLIRDLVAREVINVVKVSTDDNVADVLTKVLKTVSVHQHLSDCLSLTVP